MATLKGFYFLRLEHFERVHNPSAGLAGHNDVVDIAALGCLQGVRELFLIVEGLLFRVLASEDNLYGALGSHNSDLSRGPSVVEISLEMLG